MGGGSGRALTKRDVASSASSTYAWWAEGIIVSEAKAEAEAKSKERRTRLAAQP